MRHGKETCPVPYFSAGAPPCRNLLPFPASLSPPTLDFAPYKAGHFPGTGLSML